MDTVVGPFEAETCEAVFESKDLLVDINAGPSAKPLKFLRFEGFFRICQCTAQTNVTDEISRVSALGHVQGGR